ncbi:hypothetical protein DRP98_00590 [candidate division KSB1 bacterium]|nr:MAG: hypothetical protein DRQ00_11335 [candidate division KSB1 bacterium]RKY79011.1 MAG: hypothetical protein DRQ12_04770 [candidate division KSB1 bacterium]RKY86372.1 MAG: hypothetical protein DRP98_00590 [candidate division KSB1 bacterium]
MLLETDWKKLFLKEIQLPEYVQNYSLKFLSRHEQTLDLTWSQSFIVFVELFHKNRLDDALQVYHQFLKRYPPHGWLMMLVGHIYCYHLADYFRAREFYRIAEKEIPQFPKVQMDLGLIQMVLGNWKSALQHYQNVESCAANDSANETVIRAQALFNQAIIFSSYCNNGNRAIELLQSALDIRPDYALAQEMLQKLQQQFSVGD